MRPHDSRIDWIALHITGHYYCYSARLSKRQATVQRIWVRSQNNTDVPVVPEKPNFPVLEVQIPVSSTASRNIYPANELVSVAMSVQLRAWPLCSGSASMRHACSLPSRQASTSSIDSPSVISYLRITRGELRTRGSKCMLVIECSSTYARTYSLRCSR